MKILSVFVFNCLNEKPAIITYATDLSSFGFFTRGTIKEFLTFASREVATRTTPESRLSVQYNLPMDDPLEYKCHCHVTSSKIGCAVVADGEYPNRVAHELVMKILEETSTHLGGNISSILVDTIHQVPAIEILLKKYQNPREADNIMKIQGDLDETQRIMQKNIEDILKRGEKLNDLVTRTQDLSNASLLFWKKAKKLNATCCTFI